MIHKQRTSLIRKSFIQRTFEEQSFHFTGWCYGKKKKQMEVIVAEFLKAAKKDKNLARIGFSVYITYFDTSTL